MAVDKGTICGGAWARCYESDISWGDAYVTTSSTLFTKSQRPIPASNFELEAGASVTLTWSIDASDAPPVNLPWPDYAWVTVFEDGTDTVVREYALPVVDAPSDSGTVVFYSTHDGTSTGIPRRGIYRLRIRIAGGSSLGNTYDIDSDATHEDLPGDLGQFQLWHRRGYIRSGGPLTSLSISNTGINGTVPPDNTFVFGDAQHLAATMGAQMIAANASSVIIDQIQNSSVKKTATATYSSESSKHVASIQSGVSSGVGNSFVAGLTDTSVRIRFASTTVIGAPSGLSVSHFSSIPSGWTSSGDPNTTSGITHSPTISDSPILYKINPLINFTHLHQVDNRAFSTPPQSVDTAFRRLDQTGFIASRALDARGNGIAGLQWNAVLWDSDQLISNPNAPSATRSITSTTQGGEVGWANGMLGFTTSNPNKWVAQAIITTSNATGLEINATRELTINVREAIAVLIAIGPATETAEGDHWHSGDPLRVVVTTLNLDTGKLTSPDVAPSIILLRDNVASSTVEVLNHSMDWVSAADGYIYEHSLTINEDGYTYRKIFNNSDTDSWGNLDILAVSASVKVKGFTYPGYASREAVGRHHPHNRININLLNNLLT